MPNFTNNKIHIRGVSDDWYCGKRFSEPTDHGTGQAVLGENAGAKTQTFRPAILAGAAGMIAGAVYLKTRSIIAPIIVHALSNFVTGGFLILILHYFGF